MIVQHVCRRTSFEPVRGGVVIEELFHFGLGLCFVSVRGHGANQVLFNPLHDWGNKGDRGMPVELPDSLHILGTAGDTTLLNYHFPGVKPGPE